MSAGILMVIRKSAMVLDHDIIRRESHFLSMFQGVQNVRSDYHLTYSHLSREILTAVEEDQLRVTHRE